MNAKLPITNSFTFALQEKLATLAARDGASLDEIRESEFMQLFIALALEGLECVQTADWTPQSAQRLRDLSDRVAALELHPVMFVWGYFAQSNTGDEPLGLTDEIRAIFESEKP